MVNKKFEIAEVTTLLNINTTTNSSKGHRS